LPPRLLFYSNQRATRTNNRWMKSQLKLKRSKIVIPQQCCRTRCSYLTRNPPSFPSPQLIGAERNRLFAVSRLPVDQTMQIMGISLPVDQTANFFGLLLVVNGYFLIVFLISSWGQYKLWRHLYYDSVLNLLSHMAEFDVSERIELTPEKWRSHIMIAGPDIRSKHSILFLIQRGWARLRLYGTPQAVIEICR
jgi:hypothetical protein